MLGLCTSNRFERGVYRQKIQNGIDVSCSQDEVVWRDEGVTLAGLVPLLGGARELAYCICVSTPLHE